MKKLVSCLAATLLCTSVWSAQPVHGGQAVAPPDSNAYRELSARFWQWLYASPVSENPLFLDGNVDLSLHQPNGPVWFLGGMMTPTEGPGGEFIGHAERTGTIPAGKALFFPILNCEFANQEWSPPETMTVPQLYAFARDTMNGNQTMFCQIDGVAIDLQWTTGVGNSPYRVVSPVFFYYLPPEDNLLQHWGLDIAGKIGPAVADGVFVLVQPLAVGEHTIHFGGGTPGTFVLDITYHITVE